MLELPWRLEKRAAPSSVMRIAAPLIAAVAMFATGCIIFAFLGKNPLSALELFFIEPLNSLYGWGELLLKATPLALCGLGLAVGFAANVWNIGAEGQLTLGAICGGGVALFWSDHLGPLALPAILLAGIGTAWMWQHAPKPVVVALVGIGVAHLGWQARAASFQYGANPGNPWVYAHTGPDVSVIVKQMEALAAVSPAGHALKVQIVSKDNLWPLPWYLRRYSGAGWWNGVSDTAPLAPVILATPDMEPALLHRIYEVPPPGQREMYVNMFDRPVDLRPGLEIRGYVAKSLWDELP